jgi:site-specific DNA recombinase
VATWRIAKRQIAGITEQQVREHLFKFTDIWSELFPAEQSRIAQLLVARVQITDQGADITLRTEGLANLVQEFLPARQEQAA